jgi:hypothetical protein
MLRCVTLVAALAVLPAAAQVQRNFPANALRGTVNFTQPPEVLLNGRPARLAPGARIRAQNNMMALPGALAGQTLVVNYTRETSGLLLDVWVLRSEEMAVQPWPVNEAQMRAWTFNPAGQTWSTP